MAQERVRHLPTRLVHPPSHDHSRGGTRPRPLMDGTDCSLACQAFDQSVRGSERRAACRPCRCRSSRWRQCG
jgi:hypothetical protein